MSRPTDGANAAVTGVAPPFVPDTVAAELHPVIRTLGDEALSRAAAILSGADRDASAELADARDEAERILRQAERDGTEAASRVAVIRIAKARRDARQAVLTAQRTVYETARARALDELERRAATPAGRRLGAHLEALVQARIGAKAPTHGTLRAPLEPSAERGNCRASIGPAELVEQALQSLSNEISSLWA